MEKPSYLTLAKVPKTGPFPFLEKQLDFPLTQLLGNAKASILFTLCPLHPCYSPGASKLFSCIAHNDLFHYSNQHSVKWRVVKLLNTRTETKSFFPCLTVLPWKQWSMLNVKSSKCKNLSGVLALSRCGRWRSQKPSASFMFFFLFSFHTSLPSDPLHTKIGTSLNLNQFNSEMRAYPEQSPCWQS